MSEPVYILEFEPTPEEISDSWRLRARLQKNPNRTVHIAGMVGASIGFTLLFASRDWREATPCIGLILLGMFIVGYPFYATRLDEKRASAAPTRQRWEFRPDGIRLEVEHTRVDYSWHAFTRVLETRLIFLLMYQRSGQVALIPKRVLTDPADMKEFRELLYLKVAPQTRAFPVLVADRDKSNESSNS